MPNWDELWGSHQAKNKSVIRTMKYFVRCRTLPNASFQRGVHNPLLKDNGSMTTATLAEALGISSKAVEKHLARLKSDGIISRVGPDKGGHWEVN